MTGRPWALPAGQKPWRSRRVWLGILLSVISLILAVRGIELNEVLAALRGASPAWLGIAVALVLVNAITKAIRWRILLRPDHGLLGINRHSPSASAPDAAQSTASIFRLSRIWLAGTGLNLALPAPRSGDLARIYLAGEADLLSKSRVLGTVAAEKLLDMVMLAICFLALVPLIAFPSELAERWRPVVGLTLISLAVTAVMLWQRRRLLAMVHWLLLRLPERWGLPLLDTIERALDGLDALGRPSAILGLVVWTMIAWFISAAVNYAVFLAQGLPPSWIQAFFVLVVLQAGVAVPSSPGRIGVFQVLCRWALGVFGVSAVDGLAYGILLYLVAPVTYMITGGLALIWESWQLRQTPAKLRALVTQGEDSLRKPV